MYSTNSGGTLLYVVGERGFSYFVDPAQMNKGQPSIAETLCLLQEKVNRLTPTIQNLHVLANALE